MGISLRIIALSVFLAGAIFGGDWPMYLGDLEHTSFNHNETQLSPANIGTLRQAWSLYLHINIASSVTIVSGVLYFGDWDGNFYAVRESDGNVLWQQFLGKSAEPEDPVCQPAIGITSQPAVVDGVVYVGGGDSAVYALDTKSGRQIWRVPLADPATGSYIWSSITPFGNSVLVGIASLGDCPLVRGSLVRIALDHPNEPLIRYLSPDDDVGGGVWTTPAVDASTNTVFITTGTGEQMPETGLWGGTFMALDATTLETKAYYFLPTNGDQGDIEWGSSPTLFQDRDGNKLVAATGKDGILYALNRDDLSVRWTVPLAEECICPECGCGSLSTPAFDGKLLYVGAGTGDITRSDLGSLFAIDATTGAVIWADSLKGTVIAPPTLANGMVFTASTDGMAAYDCQTGLPLWSDNEYSRAYSQPVVLDGTLFTTYVNGDVLAWRLPDAQTNPASTPVPAVHRH